MTDTTHVRIYQADKERIEELQEGRSLVATLSKAVDALEEKQDTE